MGLLTYRVVAKPRARYLPFSEPRFKGRYVSGMARKSFSKAFALPLFLGGRDRARSFQAEAKPRPMFLSPSTFTSFGKPLASSFSPVPDRWEEIHRRARRVIDWRPKANPVNMANFIERYGMAAFKSKICEERALRREVMHARGIAGRPVSPPTWDIRSTVRC